MASKKHNGPPVDPKKLRQPVNRPLTREDVNKGTAPLGIGRRTKSPRSVNRAASAAEVKANEARAQKVRQSRIRRDPKLPPRQKPSR